MDIQVDEATRLAAEKVARQIAGWRQAAEAVDRVERVIRTFRNLDSRRRRAVNVYALVDEFEQALKPADHQAEPCQD